MGFDLILMIFLSYRNSVRAKLKGKKPFPWALITLAAYFAGYIVGCFFIVIGFCGDVININQLSNMDKAAQQAASQQLVQVLIDRPLYAVTIELFGIGGYLLVRYILGRIPDKKEPEIHWMDKMGGDQ